MRATKDKNYRDPDTKDKVVAIVVQLVVYMLVRLVLPNLSTRIAAGELAAALFLGAASLAAGVINAAAMSF